MGSSETAGLYVRVPRRFLEEFDETVKLYGLSRSEAVREAMKMLLEVLRAPSVESLKGLCCKSKIPVEELDKLVLPG